MARIRTIKPEMASDRKMANVSRDARYTFVLLISQSDDDGLIRAEPRQLLGSLYPHDDDVSMGDLEGWILELIGIGVVRWRITRDGMRVAELVNWSRHQYIKNRSKPFLLTQLETDTETRTTPSPAPTENGGSPSVHSGGAESGVLSLESRAHSGMTDAFLGAWEVYPKRPNNSRASAWRAWSARLKAGVTESDLLAGTVAYAAFVQRERTEPRYVKVASTFYGPDEHFRNDYLPPEPDTKEMTDEYGRMVLHRRNPSGEWEVAS